MATIYSKTADGQNEIETRARRLTPRARSALILVDGKRSNVELGKLVQQADETLQALLEQGLIEVVATVSSRSAAKDEGPTSVPGPASAPSPALAMVEFEATRRDAVRAINDLLGPEAETLALKIERASDELQLRSALERAVAYIANARGGGAATQFAAKFLIGQ
jgi:dsDNA-specific endonuclease/ATPase MutS2